MGGGAAGGQQEGAGSHSTGGYGWWAQQSHWLGQSLGPRPRDRRGPRWLVTWPTPDTLLLLHAEVAGSGG